MVNSYKYQSKSPAKYKQWTPTGHNEERYKKKRAREDDYIQTFEEENKPILVIKRKHEYHGVKGPQALNDPKEDESFYKVSENTQIVEDITSEIQQMENFIRRHTFVHKGSNLGEE